MKTIHFILLLLLSVPGMARDFDHKRFLNKVILTLPPEYFADIPLKDRLQMLGLLSENAEDGRLNYNAHFLAWSEESKNEQGNIEATCSLTLKLLPRFIDRDFQNPYPPFVLIILDKGISPAGMVTENQIFVLMWKRDKWIDVSDEFIPGEVDRRKRYRIERNCDAFSTILPQNNSDGTPILLKEKQLVVWENDKLELRQPFPVYSDCTTDEPFDPGELATLALTPEKDPRRLMWLITYAGLEKDQRFRYLLDLKQLKANESLALALAGYNYALDKNEESLDFIIETMKLEGGGDTNSLLIISYMDEWKKSTEVLRNWRGDGAVGEAMYCFHEIRKYLYPEQYRKYRENQGVQ